MIAIINYEAGNIKSVKNALNRLGAEAIVTEDITAIRQADKVIFPGVGDASFCMKKLREKKLDEEIKKLKQPVLGICLGLQLLCDHSEEGNTPGLGIFPNRVKKFPQGNEKVPHMGWNDTQFEDLPLFQGLGECSDFYFVHGYYAELGAFTTGTTEYILPFSSCLQKDNFYAVQFHPEKSGTVGENFLKNFLEKI